ncbi:MAG: DNA translocase FtsK [Flavobacteriales bacterium]|nr:DNA translocase FtsK [Flavobacteriales bacterium]
MAKNTIKDLPKEDLPEEELEKPKKKKKKETPVYEKTGGIRGFFADQRVKKIIGIFMVLGALFLFTSFVSYLFTATHDLRLVLETDSERLLSQEVPYKNVMGKMGAHVAYFFMNKYFGIGALFLAFLLFLWGMKVWWGKHILPIFKSIRLSVLGMLFFPLAIGFLFHKRVDGFDRTIDITCNQNLVGGYGHFATEWMTFTLGWIGTFVVLAFVFAAYLIFNFNHQVEAFWSRLWQMGKKGNNAITPDKDEWDEEEPIAPTLTPEPTTISVSNLYRGNEFEGQSVEEIIETEVEPEVEEIRESLESISQAFQVGDLEVEAPPAEEELSDTEIDQVLKASGPYDPRLDLGHYQLPPIDLLKAHGTGAPTINKEELEENKNKIVDTLNQYKIEIAKIKATIGPTVTLYEIVPAPGVRISKIKNLEDDIALSLAALGIRIIAPIPGKGTIGIEVPNSKADVVSMRSLIASDKFQNADMELPVVLGKTISNETFVTDLAKMPHLLMAGATGQGKSVGLNAILVSLLYKKHPSEIKFVLVDPKKVELTLFNKIERHFLAKLPDEGEAIITDTSKVVKTLNSLCIEMDSRYELLKMAGCRNIKEYNGKFVQRRLNPENGHRYLPYIVLVVDEFADLIMTAGREVETPIARLAQLARAIGIHLIIATQRPSVNIITGLIKANFPARIAFRVTSKIDSRTILDAGGADQLIGRGDMLFSTGNDLIRIQCGFVDTPEVEEITAFIGSQQGYPSALLLPEVIDESSSELSNFADDDRDELFAEAARIVIMTQQGSASMLQRKLKLGYNRAGRLIDQLEAAGIIGPFEGSKARKVNIQDEMSLEQFLKSKSSNEPF